VARVNPVLGMKLYLEVALVADSLVVAVEDDTVDYAAISNELFTQAFALYEDGAAEQKMQQRCIEAVIGALIAARSLKGQEYEGLITRTAQFAAKVVKKPDQCRLVALCAYLFFPVDTNSDMKYSNPQRALECLQRALKLADACTATNPSNVRLFVELLEHYVFFFEHKNPAITHAYITGLVALIREHVNSREGMGNQGVTEAKEHFFELVRYIKHKKADPGSSELFGPVQVDIMGN